MYKRYINSIIYYYYYSAEGKVIAQFLAVKS